MTRAETLSPGTRHLLRASALLYAALGVPLFVAPGWAATNFGWKVTDFQVMTIGGWCLANAVITFEAARIWRFSTVCPALVYLWTFAVMEVAVLVWFHDKVVFDGALFCPYAITLGVALAGGVLGFSDYLRSRPATEAGAPVSNQMRTLWLAFFVIVAFLFAVAMAAPDAALDGRVFPEPMTPFTLRAFGVFYLALGLGALPLLRRHSWSASIFYLTRAEALIVIIMTAAIVHAGRFDFTRLGHYIYPGAYIGAGVVSVLVLWWYYTKARPSI